MRRPSFLRSFIVRGLLPALLVAVPAAPALFPLSVHAQSEQLASRRGYDIPSGSLEDALNRFARQSGITLSFDPAQVSGRSTASLQGEYTVQGGLAALLAPHQLQAVRAADGSYSLRALPRPTAAEPASVTGAASATAPARDAQLPEVTVESQLERDSPVGPDHGYVAKRSYTGSKTDTPLIEIPQSISVVTSEQVAAQGAQSVEQAFNYTPGVTVGSNGPSTEHDYVFSRGFIARQFLDGGRLHVDYVTGAQMRIEPYGLERLEVLRGPSSVLYGQLEPGGMVNLVTKRPTADPIREVQLQAGSFDRVQGAFDFSGPMNEEGTVLYRLTGLARDSDTQSDFMEDNRRFIAPSLTLRPSADTSLTFLTHYQKDDGGGRAQPLPPQGTIVPNPNGTIPSNRFIGEPGFDGMEREQYSAGYVFEHRFDETWAFRQNLRYSHVDFVERFMFTDLEFGSFPADLRTVDRYPWDDRNQMDIFNLDNQVESRFATGGAQHTLLLGVDYRQVQNDWQFYYASVGPLDVFDPVYGSPVGPMTQFYDQSQAEKQVGLYVQDQIRWNHWLLTLGGRYDRAESTTIERIWNTEGETSDDATTGRIGLTYLFDNGLAPYASYATSFDPVSGLNAASQPFEPSTGKQAEIGIKYQPPGSSSLIAVSAFDLVQRNVLTPDAAFPGFQTQTGEIEVRGLEIEARAGLRNGLELIASYTWMESEITESNNGDVGQPKPYTPENQASLWVDYTLSGGPLAGLGIGGGVRYRSEVFGFQHVYEVPDYTLVDAALRYDLARMGVKGAQVSVNVRNLADKLYLSNCNPVDGCIYGDRRTVLATLRYNW